MVLNAKGSYCGFPYIKIVDFIKKKKKDEMKKRMVPSKFVVQKQIHIIENLRFIVFKGGNQNEEHTFDKSITEKCLESSEVQQKKRSKILQKADWNDFHRGSQNPGKSEKCLSSELPGEGLWNGSALSE